MTPLGINDDVENVILLLQFTVVLVNNTGPPHRSPTVTQRQVLSRLKKKTNPQMDINSDHTTVLLVLPFLPGQRRT